MLIFRITNYDIIRWFFGTVITVITLFGLVAYEKYNYLPVRPILEVSFFMISIFVLNRVCKGAIFFSAFFLIYVSLSYFYMILFGAGGILDFLVIYKSYIYFIFLAFFVGKPIFGEKYVEYLFTSLLFVFFVKYLVWLVLGVSTRPGLYGENNFELVFLLLIFICSWSIKKSISPFNAFLLLGIFVFSGSRSGIAALFAVVFILNMRKLDYKFFVGLIVVGVAGAGMFHIFMSRMTEKGLDGIDRYVFFMSFLNDISYWHWYHYFVGTSPITPMSKFTCDRLSFYQNLFSYYDSSICYSAILHSFVLRTIYDHGLIGLSLLLVSINYGLAKAMYTLKERLSVLGVLFLTGLSISSINSIFVSMSLLLMYSIKRVER